jgi:phage terminase small subunit
MTSPEGQENLLKPESLRPNGKYRENSLRFRRFTDEYLKTGNAYQSALAAGYSRATAESDSYKLARLVKVKMAEALRTIGVDEISVARKLKDLLEDEDPKIRLDASRECLKLLEAYPDPTLANAPKVQLVIYAPQQNSLSDYPVVEVQEL